METKISKLKQAANNGDWIEALRIASKFPRLGEHKAAITRAWAAAARPEFYRQIGRNPEAEIEAGIIALKERYGI